MLSEINSRNSIPITNASARFNPQPILMEIITIVGDRNEYQESSGKGGALFSCEFHKTGLSNAY